MNNFKTSKTVLGYQIILSLKEYFSASDLLCSTPRDNTLSACGPDFVLEYCAFTSRASARRRPLLQPLPPKPSIPCSKYEDYSRAFATDRRMVSG